jgi:hypothetical protein
VHGTGTRKAQRTGHAIPCDGDGLDCRTLRNEALAGIGGLGRVIDIDSKAMQDGKQGFRTGDAESPARIPVGRMDTGRSGQ